ncbi:uncharacterized protein E6C27_scaffold84G001150 [Cucumis melo var. makuwa]|uniref:Uncharacterized protein n=1 Tax=Cucumis melo var. makuwa TaxID=1194695 RepID=A0A5A7T828_CUCMM|nr:uncharacterized protein E6C27_scaffold84G001150 [Cucumis melo var. makuwa]
MDDFDEVLGMKFLLEHKVIAKCLVITRCMPTVVHTKIKQSNEMEIISAFQLKKSVAHKAVGATKEMTPQDTLCI